MAAIDATSVVLDAIYPPAFIALFKITSVTAAYVSTAGGDEGRQTLLVRMRGFVARTQHIAHNTHVVTTSGVR